MTGAQPTVPPFPSGGDFTVGAEDELLLVDAEGRPTAADPTVLADLQERLAGVATVSPELFACEVELGTPVLTDGFAVADILARCRAALRALGQRALAVGLHPAAPFGEAELTRSPHYDAVGAELAGLLRTPTAAFQVHVGLPDEDALVAAYRGLRNQLALFVALAAGTPYWHGRDSGLASARSAVLWSYPRGGLPPVLRGYDDYVRAVTAEAEASELTDIRSVWWDVRPRPDFGTLEIRVMDSQCSLDRAAALAALAQGLARHAVERGAAPDLPDRVLVANQFRAGRYGLEARIVGPDGRLRPLREVAAAAAAQARDVLLGDGLAGPLDALRSGLVQEAEYERQRRVHAQLGLAGLVADLARRTTPDDALEPVEARR